MYTYHTTHQGHQGSSLADPLAQALARHDLRRRERLNLGSSLASRAEQVSIRTHVHTYTCAGGLLCLPDGVCAYVHMCIRTHVHTYTCAYVHMCRWAALPTGWGMCIRTHVHMHAHTHLHA